MQLEVKLNGLDIIDPACHDHEKTRECGSSNSISSTMHYETPASPELACGNPLYGLPSEIQARRWTAWKIPGEFEEKGARNLQDAPITYYEHIQIPGVSGGLTRSLNSGQYDVLIRGESHVDH
jgi:hypothetical protein